MRLINIYTLKLEEFFAAEIPRYYILSHRWGPDEVSYKEYVKKKNTKGSGYRKIVDACDLARRRQSSCEERHGIEHLWIDTCCIDKRSSAELSEAINSMFKWYKRADLCIVYLADVPGEEEKTVGFRERAFRQSDWFSRGWTLQELLAPLKVAFFDTTWSYLGAIARNYFAPGKTDVGSDFCSDIADLVVKSTGIPKSVLLESLVPEKSKSSVAQRMSWAARRKTTRVEDEAYCLLGLFDINMALLYGEGPRAFMRLQEEILKRSRDQSILAWGLSSDIEVPYAWPKARRWPLLAPSPRWFRGCGNIIFDASAETQPSQPVQITAEGVETEAKLIPVSTSMYLKKNLRYENPLFIIQALELNCKCGPITDHNYGELPYLALPLFPRNQDVWQDLSERQYYDRFSVTSLVSLDELPADKMVLSPSARARIVVPIDYSFLEVIDNTLKLMKRFACIEE